MRKLKDILDKGLGSKWSLTPEESSSLWESVSGSLPSAAPKHGGFLYWGVAAAVAAAVVAGFFLLKSPSSELTPFQPEITPIEKTTTLAEGNGNAQPQESEQEKDNQNSLLAFSDRPSAKGRQSLSEKVFQHEEETLPGTDGNEVSESKVKEDAEPESIEIAESENKALVEPEKRAVAEPESKDTAKPESNHGNRMKKERRKDYSDNPAFGKKVTLFASSNFSGRAKMDGSSSPLVKALAEETMMVMHSHAPEITHVSDASYSLPLNFAIGVNYKINNYLAIGSGVSYSFLHSKYNGRINMVDYTIKQNVHYIGIPVNVYVNLGSTGNLDFYAAAGGSIEKGIKVDYQLTSITGKKSSTDSHVKGVQFSVKAAGGIEYHVGKNVGIYLEPAMVYYFDSKLPASIRTDQPLQIEAQAGVRFHIK